VAEIPDNPDTMLTRAQVAEALTASGYPVRSGTLATKASRPGKSGAPPYRVFSGRTLYRWGDALAWAQAATSAPRRSTSEHQVQAAA